MLALTFRVLSIRIYILVLFSLNFLIWLAAYNIYTAVSQDLVVLHYNVDFGVNLIGSVKQIFIIPTLGLIIILVNLIVSIIFIRRENFKFVSHVLLSAAVLAHLFLFASLGSIYLINFR